MRYDATLKELFQALPQILLKLLIGQEAIELLTVEFPSVKKRLPDLVVRLADGSIFHLELQSSVDEVMVWRMLEYYALIRRLYPDAILIQQVLYVGSDHPSFTTNIAENTLQFRYSVKDIRDIDCQQMLNGGCLEENLLAILCHQEDERKTIRAVVSQIAVLPPKARADALEKLVILAGLRQLGTTVKEEVKNMAITVNVMENEFLRDLFMEGEQKGGSTMLLRLLQHRFGNLPSWAGERIANADLPTLEAWSLRFMDAKSLDDVFES